MPAADRWPEAVTKYKLVIPISGIKIFVFWEKEKFLQKMLQEYL